MAGTVYHRANTAAVRDALESLRIPVPAAFRAFYERYQGPFSSRRTGFELLDLCEGTDSVIGLSRVCRQQHRFLERHLVLTSLLGNAVLVLDAQDDHVYNVDFEGGDEALLAGRLEWAWQSFEDFLLYYFGASGSGGRGGCRTTG